MRAVGLCGRPDCAVAQSAFSETVVYALSIKIYI